MLPATPSSPEAAIRRAALLRIVIMLVVFTLLLAGAIWLTFRGGRVVQPEPLPAETPKETLSPAQAETPAPDAGEVFVPVLQDPLLAGEARMADILAGLRDAAASTRTGDVAKAEAHLRDVLKLDPRNATAQRMIGGLYLQRGQFPNAVAALEASLQNDPYNPEALTNLALTYLQIRDIARAEELIGIVRRLYPNYTPALIQEGVILMTANDPAAEDVLREAARILPKVPSIRNNLAVMLARGGNLEEAREILRGILEETPEDTTALFNLGASYAKEGNAAEAIPYLRDALARLPQRRQREMLEDKDLEPIRYNPAFVAFIKSLDPTPPPPPARAP